MARPSIPGLEVDELQGKVLASQSRAVGPSLRPNFTMPDGRPPLQIGGPPPNTALTIRNAPNFTMPPPIDTGARQAFDIDAGPGNPNVRKPGDIGGEWRSANMGPKPQPTMLTEPPPVSMRDRIAGGLRELKAGATGPTARGAATAAGPAVLGAAVGYGQRRSDLAQRPEPFVPAAAKPGGIPSDPSVTGPPVVPMRRPLGIGADSNNAFASNVANTMMALTPFGAGPAAATRLPIAASNVGTPGRIRAGADFAARGAQQFVAGAQGGAALADNTNQQFVGLPVVDAGANGYTDEAARFASRAPIVDRSEYLSGGKGQLPSDLSMLNEGQVYKTKGANGIPTYSGVNVREGASIVNGRGEKTGELGGLTTIPGGGGGGGDSNSLRTFGPSSGGLFADQALSEARLTAAARGTPFNADGSLGQSRSLGDGGITTGQQAGSFGGGVFGFSDPKERSAKMDAERRLPANAGRQEVEMAMRREQLAEQRRSSDQNASVQMTGINTGAQTTMRGQDIGAGTATRGQDMTLAANKANNRLAVMRDQREQSNWQATHNAGRSDAKFNQQQQATKNLQDQIAGFIPLTMQDGKQVPDTQTAARHSVAIQTVVGRMGKTLADLDDVDKGRLIQGMQLADVASGTATNGITPWGTKAIVSNEPIMALEKMSDGNYRTNRLGLNNEQEIIPARYVEKEGSLFGLQYFGKSSNRFQGMIQGEKK
jgi:hypothetical protein